MNSRIIKAAGSIYDTLYVAQISRDTRNQGFQPQRLVANVYDASQARFSPKEAAAQVTFTTQSWAEAEGNKDSK